MDRKGLCLARARREARDGEAPIWPGDEGVDLAEEDGALCIEANRDRRGRKMGERARRAMPEKKMSQARLAMAPGRECMENQ